LGLSKQINDSITHASISIALVHFIVCCSSTDKRPINDNYTAGNKIIHSDEVDAKPLNAELPINDDITDGQPTQLQSCCHNTHTHTHTHHHYLRVGDED